MIITRRVAIDERAVFVCDKVFSKAAIKNFHAVFDKKGYFRDARPVPTSHKATWVTPLSVHAVKGTDVYNGIVGAVSACFPGMTLKLYRVYCNNLTYGDSPYIHRDQFPGSTDITAVYYVNSEWKADWCGETVFYDESDDAAAIVSPRPGRVTIAHATLKHRAGIPQRDCYASRLTLVMSFTAAPAR